MTVVFCYKVVSRTGFFERFFHRNTPELFVRQNNDDRVREVIGDSNVTDAVILDLLREFLPSYGLDYTAPARLGLAAYICSRRPHLAALVFSIVAGDYFQLGVVTKEGFSEAVDYDLREQPEIVIRHGDVDALAWLRESVQVHFDLVGERLAELEEEFQREEDELNSSDP